MSKKPLILKMSEFIESKTINELNTETYAKVMNNTESFPWSRFNNPNTTDSRGNIKADKQERVNSLARERFTFKFLKEFPPEETTIQTDQCEFLFKNIKFNTNYTNYALVFVRDATEFEHMSQTIFIDSDGTTQHPKYFVSNKVIITDEESEKTILKMLRFHFQ